MTKPSDYNDAAEITLESIKDASITRAIEELLVTVPAAQRCLKTVSEHCLYNDAITLAAGRQFLVEGRKIAALLKVLER
jgi:hypothetical protein